MNKVVNVNNLRYFNRNSFAKPNVIPTIELQFLFEPSFPGMILLFALCSTFSLCVKCKSGRLCFLSQIEWIARPAQPRRHTPSIPSRSQSVSHCLKPVKINQKILLLGNCSFHTGLKKSLNISLTQHFDSKISGLLRGRGPQPPDICVKQKYLTEKIILWNKLF